MSESRARHDREIAAIAGKAYHVSREYVRKAGVVRRTFIDGEDALMKGESLNELYNLAVGDTRVGLFIKVPPWLRQRIKAEANELGITQTEMLVNVLTQIFG